MAGLVDVIGFDPEREGVRDADQALDFEAGPDRRQVADHAADAGRAIERNRPGLQSAVSRLCAFFLHVQALWTGEAVRRPPCRWSSDSAPSQGIFANPLKP